MKKYKTQTQSKLAREEKKMCKRLKSIIEKTKADKKEAEVLQKRLESADEERFNKPIEELTLEELYELEAKLKKIHVRIQGNIDNMQGASSLMFLSKDK
ncbi:Agamous-like MADS-box protein AGL29 [Cardamine amara subsp. amara]|uniref:Agamous-like MADS-box protein AGL29 n=1 Tax=Cardamine amara subsp. amara TaxID=228776 RepID=A0ABD0Z2M5_CARAN